MTGEFQLRPAYAQDRAQISRMIRARAAWLRDHGHSRWRSWDRDAETLGEQAAEADWPVFVLTRATTVVGCTTITEETPQLGWTETDRTESALFLQSTVTHPALAGQGIGILIAFAALNIAAERDIRWVRRGVLSDDQGANLGLIHYYRAQGWQVVRALRHPRRADIRVWSLQRPAELHDLPELTIHRTETGATFHPVTTDRFVERGVKRPVRPRTGPEPGDGERSTVWL
ncbi:MAG: GNAT family N-acetyltransferase [Sciscionella sp.]